MKYVNYKGIDESGEENGDWPELCNNNFKRIKEQHMNGQQQAEDRLWNYIDGSGDAAEKSAIEQLIATNMEWQNKYHELLEVHQLMSSSELDAPSMRFTKNVMEEIARFQVAPAARSYINKKIIWGIAGFFIVMFVGFLVYALGQVNWSDATVNSPSLLAKYNLDKKIDFGKIFSSTYTSIFMLINIILGFVLLDMYLQRKKEQHSHRSA